MPLLFDHNPDTGVTQYFDYDELTDTMAITSVQDVSEILDDLQKKKNDPEAWKKGVKQSFAHFASIPPIVELELRKKGINIYDKNCTKRLIQEIEQNYPYLKATDAKLWRPKVKHDKK